MYIICIINEYKLSMGNHIDQMRQGEKQEQSRVVQIGEKNEDNRKQFNMDTNNKVNNSMYFQYLQTRQVCQGFNVSWRKDQNSQAIQSAQQLKQSFGSTDDFVRKVSDYHQDRAEKLEQQQSWMNKDKLLVGNITLRQSQSMQRMRQNLSIDYQQNENRRSKKIEVQISAEDEFKENVSYQNQIDRKNMAKYEQNSGLRQGQKNNVKKIIFFDKASVYNIKANQDLKSSLNTGPIRF